MHQNMHWYNWKQLAFIGSDNNRYWFQPHETFVQQMEQLHPYHDAVVYTAELSAENLNFTLALEQFKVYVR